MIMKTTVTKEEALRYHQAIEDTIIQMTKDPVSPIFSHPFACTLGRGMSRQAYALAEFSDIVVKIESTYYYATMEDRANPVFEDDEILVHDIDAKDVDEEDFFSDTLKEMWTYEFAKQHGFESFLVPHLTTRTYFSRKSGRLLIVSFQSKVNTFEYDGYNGEDADDDCWGYCSPEWSEYYSDWDSCFEDGFFEEHCYAGVINKEHVTEIRGYVDDISDIHDGNLAYAKLANGHTLPVILDYSENDFA